MLPGMSPVVSPMRSAAATRNVMVD